MARLRLLSLDGGGVRGLSSLMILQRLLKDVDPKNPPKPCDFFDMIGGTSTGGLIAIMLGRLHMTVQECIDAYIRLSEQVFVPKKSRVPVVGKLRAKWHMKEKFDSAKLKEAIQNIVARYDKSKDPNVMLRIDTEPRCRVFVCATRRQKVGTVLFRNYSSNVKEVEPMIWEACRATSAAATFFDPVSIGPFGEEFIDGATESNNPIERLLEEARRVWQDIETRMGCILSIGTGQSPLTAWGENTLEVIDTLKGLATETEKTEKRFRMSLQGGKCSNLYFRFNVERGLEKIGLEEHTKMAELVAATRIYLDNIPERIASFLETVLTPEGDSSEGAKDNQHLYKNLLQSFNEMHNMDLDDHLAAVHDPEAKTFQWIFQTPIMTDLWVSSSSQIIQFIGKPGCGKTVLARMLYKHSVERLSTRDGIGKKKEVIAGDLDSSIVPLLFFAFKDTDAKRRTASNLLSGLIAQVVGYLGAKGNKSSSLVTLREMHARRAETTGGSREVWTWSLLQKNFIDLMTCGSYQSIICVIDALDECEAGTERNSLLDCFETVVERGNQNGYCFKFLITSRSFHDIRFDQSHARHIELDDEDNMDTDLDVFIRAGVNKLVKKRPGYMFHQSRVIEILRERADKMYLLVSLLLQILEENTDSSPDALEKALYSLPSDVTGVYHRIWSRIKLEDRSRAKVWFSWILLSFKSLSIEQFAAALVVRNAHTDDYDLELYQCLKETLQEDLQRLFGPLLRFVTLESSGEVHIEISHQTVKDYFLMSPDSDISSPPARIAIHTEMAKVCLPWNPNGMFHKFDQMFDAVRKHFGDPTTNWTVDNIWAAFTLVVKQIFSTTALNFPDLPTVLRESSFGLYATRHFDHHLVAALLDMIQDVAPSLIIGNNFGDILFRTLKGELMLEQFRIFKSKQESMTLDRYPTLSTQATSP